MFFLLALQNATGVGDLTARKIIGACGSAEAVFKEKPGKLKRVAGVRLSAVESVLNKENLRAAELQLREIADQNIKVITYGDKRFPERLRHCPDGPLLLFVKGDVDFQAKRFVSIVGTRRLTREGREFCERFIEDLSPLNPTVVSGYAYGADICAHKAAIANGLQTVACMAHGLDFTYPSAHTRYNAAMMNHGGFITDFWLGVKPERDHFLRRNRIIAGISEAVVVIESAEKGGSLVTADIANSYNREVFAVPGKPADAYSRGCNRLIKRQEAHLLESAADLAFMLGWDPDEKQGCSGVQKQLFVDLDPSEETVFTVLNGRGKMLLDELAMCSGLPVHRLTSTLLGLEMKGVVRPLPGKYYELI